MGAQREQAKGAGLAGGAHADDTEGIDQIVRAGAETEQIAAPVFVGNPLGKSSPPSPCCFGHHDRQRTQSWWTTTCRPTSCSAMSRAGCSTPTRAPDAKL